MDSRTGRSYEELDANIVFAIFKKYFILLLFYFRILTKPLWMSVDCELSYYFFILLLISCKTVLVGQQEVLPSAVLL